MSGATPPAGAEREGRREKPFFSSRWVDPPAEIDERDPAELAPGFRAAGVASSVKAGGELDLGLMVCDVEDVDSAAMLTANAAAAAPVRLCRDRADLGALRAIAVNSGCANAATGEEGYADAVEMQGAAARACGLDTAAVGVASTGSIADRLPLDRVRDGIGAAADRLTPDGGGDFARAILTTDRGPKACSLWCDGVRLSAQAKGAGMIEPGFATMLCFVQTDAIVPGIEGTLERAVAPSFARITVDGQLSTNDAVFMQASGASGRYLPPRLLESVLLQLALEILADGEGATRTARLRVEGAASAQEAERAARAVANSPLVQTALHGRDPNWGRIVQAAGMALAGERLDIGAEDVEADELGSEAAEAELALRLGRGSESATVYFSDLTCDYVKLNAEYTT